MYYNYRYGVIGGYVSRISFKDVLIVILLGLLAFMTFVALHNAKPVQCDDVVQEKDNGMLVCEIGIK